jgi:spore coat protein CotF
MANDTEDDWKLFNETIQSEWNKGNIQNLNITTLSRTIIKALNNNRTKTTLEITKISNPEIKTMKKREQSTTRISRHHYRRQKWQ